MTCPNRARQHVVLVPRPALIVMGTRLLDLVDEASVAWMLKSGILEKMSPDYAPLYSRDLP